MSAPPTIPPTRSVVIPEDVRAFAKAEGIEAALEPMIEVTRQIYPTAEKFRIWLQHDPELRDVKAIIYFVTVGGLTHEESYDAQTRWIKELTRVCPTHNSYLYCLMLDLH